MKTLGLKRVTHALATACSAGRLITAHIRRMREGNTFSLSTLVGAYPVPGPDGEGGGEICHPRSGQGGTPSQVQMGRYPIPGLDWGGYPIQGLDGGYPTLLMGVPHPRSGWGVPHPRSGQGGTPSQVWMGGIQDQGGGTWGVPPVQDWKGYSPSIQLDGVLPIQEWMGYLPVEDWMGYCPIQEWMRYPPPPSAKQSLATQQAACLLHSRRRIFLFLS